MRMLLKSGVASCRYIACVIAVLLQGLSVNSFAQDAVDAVPSESAGLTAHQTVELTTDKMLSLVKSAEEYFDKDEARFYIELREVLSPFVDFDSFARAVMGKYASKSYVASLAPADQEVLLAKVQKFSTVFSEGLIRTYGKGLLAFEGERVDVVSPENVDPAATKATVKQLIYGKGDDPFVVLYSMRRNAEQEWKLRNVMVQGVDLGRTYRNQFYNAMDIPGSDIDQVIENWSVTPSN